MSRSTLKPYHLSLLKAILLPRPPKVTTASFSAQLQANITAQAGSAGAQYIQQQTGVDVTQTRVANGISAGGQLIAHGFDPTSANDRQAMVAMMCAGLSLIEPVGGVLAAALEALYQIAQPLACPVAKFFRDIGISQSDCDSPPCAYSGPAPTVDVLAANFALPQMWQIPGTFGQLATGALLTNAASALSCKSSVPPSVIVDATVNAWNQANAGPAVDVYVPPLMPLMPFIPQWTNVQNNYSGSTDPNLYFAFVPAAFLYWGDDITKAPAPPPMDAFIQAQQQIFGALYAAWPSEQYPSPSRYVQVNVGAPLGATDIQKHIVNLAPIVSAMAKESQANLAASQSKATTAAKAAAGTAAIFGAGALGIAAVVAYAKGRTISAVLDAAWEKTKRL